MLRTLIEQYGYLAILVGTFFEGEMVLVLGGLAAKLGYLELHWVMLSAFAGTVCGDQMYFFIGRRYGARLLRGHPHWQLRAAWITRHLERHQVPLILGFRYLYGIRTLVPLVMGMSAISTPRFMLLHIMGAALWAIGVGFIGYAFGNVAEVVLGELDELEPYLIGLVILISVTAWLYYGYRRRRLLRRDRE